MGGKSEIQWSVIIHPFERRISARDKNKCPDCGNDLKHCKAGDIIDEFKIQPKWADQQTDARKCECGFYYLRVGPSGFYMKLACCE